MNLDQPALVIENFLPEPKGRVFGVYLFEITREPT